MKLNAIKIKLLSGIIPNTFSNLDWIDNISAIDCDQWQDSVNKYSVKYKGSYYQDNNSLIVLAKGN